MGDHQIFSLAFLIPSLSIYTFPISFLFSFLRYILMESASVKWHRQTRWLLPPCLIKWAVTLAWAAKSERKNQIEMTQLMAFMVYAHFIIMRLRFFSPFFLPPLASPAVCNFPTFSTFGHFIKRRRRRP